MIGHGTKKLVERALTATAGTPSPSELDARIRCHAGDLRQASDRLHDAAAAAPARCWTACATNTSRSASSPTSRNASSRRSSHHFGLSSAFGAVIGSDAGVAIKPAPDMLFAALETLGVQPEDAVMVGDSTSDVQVGARGRPDGRHPARRLHREPAEALGADVVIDGLNELLRALPGLKSAGFERWAQRPGRPLQRQVLHQHDRLGVDDAAARRSATAPRRASSPAPRCPRPRPRGRRRPRCGRRGE